MYTDSWGFGDQLKYCMMRVTTELRDVIRTQAAMNSRSMISELYVVFMGADPPDRLHKQNVQPLAQRLKSMTMEDKVQLVLDKMKEMDIQTIHKEKFLDGNFWRAGKALGFSRPTIEKYWEWLYYNRIKGA